MTLLDPSPSVVIDSGEYYYVENHHESETMNFQWDKRKYVIPPLKKKLVPFDIIALNFGDPRSKVGEIQNFSDSTGTGQVPERIAEVKRLCVRYGVYEQGMADIHDALIQENLRLTELRKTQVQRVLLLHDRMFSARITTIDGTEIIPPLFDHQGIHQYGFALDEEKSNDIVTLIANMQRQIDALKEKEGILQGNDNDDEDIDIDNGGDMPAMGQGVAVG